jgi:N-acetylmuramoyl-L-alanine amidase
MWVVHYGGPADEQLPNIMLSEIGPQSPRTADRTLVRRDLAEISETRARAAYLEAAFHTFGNDVAFLRNPGAWAWRIAQAVDRCLGRNGQRKECTW